MKLSARLFAPDHALAGCREEGPHRRGHNPGILADHQSRPPETAKSEGQARSSGQLLGTTKISEGRTFLDNEDDRRRAAVVTVHLLEAPAG